MRINNVLYLLRADLESLPPSMSQILTLCQQGCRVTIVSMNASEYIRDFFKNQEVEFVTLEHPPAGRKNIADKVRCLLQYRKLVKRAIETIQYDLLWIGSADTARYCKDILSSVPPPTVLNIYELYDKAPKVLDAIKTIAQNAQVVVVPEYNRAHILKVWLELKKTPVVIPNKPCFREVEILPETQKIVDDLKQLDKKIVLYQGWIGRDRDVSQIARALQQLDCHNKYALVLLGTATAPDTINVLQSVFPTTVHIPFLLPPQHLFITECAHMGIATYDDSSLNNIFCAPNKIYEYAEKNVPILARDIPGLSSTIGKFKAGVCVDMSDVDAVAVAIKEIDANHETYVAALGDFMNEHSVERSISKILQTCEETMN